jgi:hypothetical protein
VRVDLEGTKGAFIDGTTGYKEIAASAGIATISLKSTYETGVLFATVTVTGLAQPTTTFLLTMYQDPPAGITVAGNKASLVSDGIDRCVLTVNLVDSSGNKITDQNLLSGKQVMFSIPDSAYGTLSDGISGTQLTQLSNINSNNTDYNLRTATVTLISPDYDGVKLIPVTVYLVGMTTITAVMEIMGSKVGVPVYLELTVDSSQLIANSMSTTTVTAYIKDAVGTLLDGSASTATAAGNMVTFTVDGPGSYPVSQKTQDAVNGRATVSLRSTSVSGQARLTVSSPGLISGTTIVSMIPGSGTKLAIDRLFPAAVTADAQSTTDLILKILDNNNNLVTNYSSTLAVTVTGGSDSCMFADGTLLTSTVAPVSGYATVSLRSTVKSGQVTITAAGTGLTSTTTGFVSVPGAAIKLAWLTADSVSTLTADGNNTKKLAVQVLDVNNNLVTDYPGQVTFNLTGDAATWQSNGSNGIINVVLTGGTASLSLRSTKVTGTVSVTGSIQGLTSCATSFVTVAGPAAKLSITVNKQTLKADGIDDTGFSIIIKDCNDNVVNTAVNTQSVQLTVDSYGMIISTDNLAVRNITVDSVNGQVAGLKIRAGTSAGTILLNAASAGLTSASRSIALVSGPAKKLAVTVQQQSLYSDGISSVSVTAVVQDVYGNTVATPDYTVTLRVSDKAGWMPDNTAVKEVSTSNGMVVT